jgi:hypothetical protein
MIESERMIAGVAIELPCSKMPGGRGFPTVAEGFEEPGQTAKYLTIQ